MRGLSFERRFRLSPAEVRRTVDNNVQVAFYDRRLFFELAGARRSLRFVPLKKGGELNFEASSPLVAIVNAGDGYRVSYGNRRVTRLHPQFFDYDASVDGVKIWVDGVSAYAPVGSVLDVRERFMVEAPGDIRVNVIGWRRKGVDNEAGQEIRRKEIARRFSVDRKARVFRVELYRGDRFSGMVLVRFTDAKTTAASRSRTEPVS